MGACFSICQLTSRFVAEVEVFGKKKCSSFKIEERFKGELHERGSLYEEKNLPSL